MKTTKHTAKHIAHTAKLNPGLREAQKVNMLQRTRADLMRLEQERIEADRRLRGASMGTTTAIAGNGWVDKH